MHEHDNANAEGFFVKFRRRFFKKPEGVFLVLTYTSLAYFGLTVIGLILERILPAFLTFPFSALYRLWMIFLFGAAIFYLLITVWHNGIVAFVPLVLSIVLMYLPSPIAYIHMRINFDKYYDQRVEVVRRIEENPALIEDYEELLPIELRNTTKLGNIVVKGDAEKEEIFIYFPITSQAMLPRWDIVYSPNREPYAGSDGKDLNVIYMAENWYAVEWREVTELEDRLCTFNNRRIWLIDPWLSDK